VATTLARTFGDERRRRRPFPFVSAPADGHATSASGRATSGDGAEQPGILIVDDDPDIVESLVMVLEGSLQGVRVLSAGSGAEALEILRSVPVQVIVTDYKMPGLNGLELLARARALRPKVGGVLCTAFPQSALGEAATWPPNVELMTKPFSAEGVLETVSRHLALDGRAG
jgi:CheY-like chemotaxis protein